MESNISSKDIIESLNKYKNDGYIFRGMINSEYALSPSIYRILCRADVKREAYEDVDYKIEETCKFIELIGGDDKDKIFNYFAIQHLGVNTKLLDFTFDPYVALWFAINEWDISKDDTNKDGIIYVIDRTQFRTVNTDDYDLLKEILFESNEQVSSINEEICGEKRSVDNKGILFLKPINGLINIKRISNQKSCFLLFPPYAEAIYELDRNDKAIVDKIIIPAELKPEISQYLNNKGITRDFIKEV